MNVKKLKANVSLKDLCYRYLVITKSIHKLRPKQIEVLSRIVYHYLKVRPTVESDAEAWYHVFHNCRTEIMDDLDMTDYSLNNLISSLRKRKVIINNTVPAPYIPDVEKGSRFAVVFEFELNGGV